VQEREDDAEMKGVMIITGCQLSVLCDDGFG